jgi:aryl-alcohol dehydrogenase-like predicted oxidoreductase
MSIAEFAFSYIRHLPGISSIVFGAETVEQVEANIALLDVPPLREDTVKQVEQAFADVPEYVVTPSLWSSHTASQ